MKNLIASTALTLFILTACNSATTTQVVPLAVVATASPTASPSPSPSVSPSPVPYSFGGGAGTSGSPYQIDTATDVTHIGDYPSAYYNVTQDINMNGVTFTSIPSFSGVIYGGGWIISNLTVSGSGASFIGTLSGTITSLSLDTVAINSSDYGAAFAQAITATGGVNYCHVTGSITSPSALGDGYHAGTGNPVYVTRATGGTVTATTMNAQFNGSTVTSFCTTGPGMCGNTY